MEIKLEPNNVVWFEDQLAVIKEINYSGGTVILQTNVMIPNKNGLGHSGYHKERTTLIKDLIPFKYPQKFRMSGSCLKPFEIEEHSLLYSKIIEHLSKHSYL